MAVGGEATGIEGELAFARLSCWHKTQEVVNRAAETSYDKRGGVLWLLCSQ